MKQPDSMRRRLLLAGAGALALAPLGARSQGSYTSTNWEFMMNRWKQDHYLHIERGGIEASQIDFGWWSAQWRWRSTDLIITDCKTPAGYNEDCLKVREAMINKFQGWYVIENRWKPGVLLHVEHGQLEASKPNSPWESAMWAPYDAGDGFIRIRNRQQTEWFLHLDENGKAAAGPIPAGYWSGHWRKYSL